MVPGTGLAKGIGLHLLLVPALGMTSSFECHDGNQDGTTTAREQSAGSLQERNPAGHFTPSRILATDPGKRHACATQHDNIVFIQRPGDSGTTGPAA